MVEHLQQTLGYDVDIVATLREDIFTRLGKEHSNYEVVLIDDGYISESQSFDRAVLSLVTEVKDYYPNIEFVLLTNRAEKVTIEALRAGVDRCLAKPINLQELEIVVKKLVEISQHKRATPLDRMLAKITALSTLPFDQMLIKIVEIACILIGADSSSILLIDEEPGNSTQAARFPLAGGKKFGPRKNGLTNFVANSGKPIVIQDAQHHPLVKRSTKERGVKYILGVPLKVRVEYESISEIRTIGALFVNSLQEREFSRRDVELLESLAAQAANAIKSSRRARALKTLHQISLEITSYHQTPELVKYILLQAVKLVRAAGGRLCLLDESGEQVKWAVMSNSPDHLAPIKMEVQGGVFERVIKTRKPFAKSDYRNWSDRRKKFDKYGFTAVAGAPIAWRDKIWGAILIHHEAEGRVFSQEELNLLESLGNLAAVALENARQLDDLERLMESAFDAIIALDESGKIVKFNRQAERILGYEAREVIGQSIRDLYYDLEDARRVRRLLLESKEGRITGFDTFLRSKNGEKIPIRLSASLLFDYFGKRAGNVGFFRDRREYEASRVVIRSLNKSEILASIAEQAWKLTGASQSSHLALTVENRLEFIAAYPPEHLSRLQQAVGHINLSEDTPIGVMGRVARTGQSQLVGNVHEDSDYILYDPETCSELAVPVKSGGKIIGVIDVEQSRYNAFGLQDQQTLEALAGYAAIAIENAQLYDQSQSNQIRLRSALARLEAVARISQKAATSLEIPLLLRTACCLLEKDLYEKQAIASIRLYDRENDILVFDPSWHESFHHLIDVKPEKGRRTQRLDEGICGWVATYKELLNIRNVNDFTGYLRLISNTQAELCVPICYGENRALIGVLDVQSPLLNAFDWSDQEFLKILADQLAVAIHNTKLYEPLQRWSQHQKAVYQTTKIVSAGVAVKQKDLLQRILEQAVKMIKLAKGDNPILGVIQLYNEATNELYLETVYPREALKVWMDRLGERRSLDRSKGSIGINGRTVLERKPQRVADVRLDIDYVLLDDTTRSELDVPLLEGDEVLGVLSLESDQLAAFDEADEWVLESLAELAVIAIQNTRQYRELEEMKDLLAVHTAVAWMWMVSATWGHSINKHVAIIKDQVKLLRSNLDEPTSSDKLKQRLANIEQMVNRIEDRPIMARLSPREVETVLINNLISQWIKQFMWDWGLYKSVQYNLNLASGQAMMVTVNPEWLKLALDNLVDNAVKAMAKSVTKELTVATRLVEDRVEIIIGDTGIGIPEELLPKLLKGQIDKGNHRTGGEGIGLLLARTIVRTYGGDMYLGSTGPEGTAMVIWLPLVARQETVD